MKSLSGSENLADFEQLYFKELSITKQNGAYKVHHAGDFALGGIPVALKFIRWLDVHKYKGLETD